jgi:acyl-coenzyme A thioesterase PaaI-like protein
MSERSSQAKPIDRRENVSQYKERLRKIADGSAVRPPTTRKLGLGGIDHWEEGLVVQHWNAGPDVCNLDNTVFGGYIAAVSDQLASFAMMSVLEDIYYFRTVDLQVSFLRVLRPGPIKVEALVLHRSRNIAHIDVNFWAEGEKLAVRSRVMQSIHEASNSKGAGLAKLGMPEGI